MTPDVNVLIAAVRADHPHHVLARDWLRAAVAAGGNGALLLLPMIVAGFLRIVTNRKVFPVPMPVDAAVAFVDRLLAAPGVRMGALGAEWMRLRELCLKGDLVANTIPDAWIAAAVLHASDHFVTFDRGFRKLLPRSQLTVLSPA